MSKVRFIDLLEELGLPHPATTIVRDRGDLLRWDQYPCFVKVDHTTAGEGVRRLDDAAQLRKAADELDRAGWFESQAAVLVQRLAPGVRRVLTAVFQHGRLVGAHCDQTLAFGVGGSSRARVSIADRQAVDHMASLGAHLGWHGALCVEYFFEPAAERREYIECNPRIGETVNALLSGVNLCEQLVRVSLDETVAPLPDSRTGVRSHQRFLALAAMALEGQGRRQMLGELWRSLRRRGWYEDSQDELTRPRDDWLSLIPYLGVTSVLLARPGAARGLIRRTVENYSLHPSAVEKIRTLQPRCFGSQEAPSGRPGDLLDPST
jgi:hypothetical protein